MRRGKEARNLNVIGSYLQAPITNSFLGGFQSLISKCSIMNREQFKFRSYKSSGKRIIFLCMQELLALSNPSSPRYVDWAEESP